MDVITFSSGGWVSSLLDEGRKGIRLGKKWTSKTNLEVASLGLCPLSDAFYYTVYIVLGSLAQEVMAPRTLWPTYVSVNPESLRGLLG